MVENQGNVLQAKVSGKASCVYLVITINFVHLLYSFFWSRHLSFCLQIPLTRSTQVHKKDIRSTQEDSSSCVILQMRLQERERRGGKLQVMT